MSEKNFTVTVDIAAPVAAKIEAVAAEYEGKYTMNNEVYKRVLNTYKSSESLLSRMMAVSRTPMFVVLTK